MTITPQQIVASTIAKAERIARIREAIRHLELALEGYEHGDDNGEVWPGATDLSSADVFGALLARPSAPVSLIAAHHLVTAAAIGYSHERQEV